MNSPKHKPLAWCIKAALLATTATSVNAFAAPEPEKEVKLEVIEVTAQRRTQNLQEVPVSVAAVQGEALDAYGSSGMDIRFLSARIPSLSIESSFGRTFPRFYVRGLGNTDFDLNASQPVSLVFDNVVMENPILKGFPVFDLEGVEVLRGPQGTLFGRNTPAGLVKFDSAKPTQDLDGYFSASYGTHNAVDLQGAVGFGLTDELSTRVSLLRQTKDNWIDNKAPGFEQDGVLGGYQEIAGRVQFLYESDDFSALLNYHWRDLNGKPIAFRANTIKSGTNDLVSGFDRDTVYHDAAHNATQRVDNQGASLTLEYVLQDHTITAITGYESVEMYSRADVDGGYGAVFTEVSGPGLIPFSAESADAIPDHQQLSQEIRVASNELGALDYQFGAFFFKEEITIESFSYDSLFSGGAQNGYAWQTQDTNAWAVFGSADYDVNETTKVTAGIRYSHDEKDFVAARTQSNLGFLGVPDEIGPFKRNPSDSQVSWDLSVFKQLNDDVNVYGRLAKGFRAPSIQGRVLFDDNLTGDDPVTVAKSETINSIEAGIKSSVWDDRARVNVSAFYYTMDDQQLTAVGGESNSNKLLNADKTNGYGFEVDSEIAITEDLLATVGLSYNKTEIKDSGLAVDYCTADKGASHHCTVLDPVNADGRAVIDGNSLPHAPEWIANFTLRYSKEFADGELFAYTDWAYRSKINFFLYEAAEFSDDKLLEGGIRVGYNWDTEMNSHEVALFGRNITNDESIIGGVDFNNVTGIVNDPAFWGVEYKISFF
ncbi:TonB-dependent receptor [Psychrobium sp. 1_MG-2023]|uniref:TonB-dependent receptor n=1 Tax=Psychrobium sp. 1_MG-2023 TaxID=3062624 RepID=UPI000C330B21|nr:TonB-dependent receptor [Psychrobium sp. 1_MG-2023]MDP2559780.1 TonB-dependent receptor [Psychrobium sp. 1_MG-2023]PKF59112.1 TonB-dependent receptor [Alteromonadales bacterium alter-6D02]